MDSKTWVFCVSIERTYPISFAGTEAEMRKAVSNLQERYRKNGHETPFYIWTGYSWYKGNPPCFELTQTGEMIELEAAA